MDTKILQKLIEKSHILTDVEKKYWSESLERMSPEQMGKLYEILTKAQGIPWTQQVSNYFNSIASSAKKAVSRT